MIKNNLSIILGSKRMKMSELAEMAGLNKNTVLNLYHDKSTRIEFEVLNKLCAALDCQPGDLFEYVPDKNEHRDFLGDLY
ncbi:MAG: helix-turn-helix transcriptional regulator [Firmicutes bacterium]|nr:helix-turn-helix transcriptional regulator [Bacillota bacterium]